jgi:ribosomal protein S12 methylthiotransferase accessory factor
MFQKMDAVFPRFVRGAVYPTPEGATLIVTPSGSHYHITADPHELAHWLTQCDGKTSVTVLLDRAPNVKDYGVLLDLLVSEQCVLLGDEVDTFVPHIEHYTVLLTGDDTLITLLQQAALLDRLTHVVTVAQHDLAIQVAAASDRPVFVVSLRTVLDVDYLHGLDALCAEHKAPWVSFHLEQGKGRLGPLVVPDRTSTYTDLLARRRCCADDDTTFLPLIASPIEIPPYVPPTSDMLWMLGIFMNQMHRWMTGMPCMLLSAEVEADTSDWSLTVHPILPLPERRIDDVLLSSWEHAADALIDERTGIIARTYRTELHPTMPDSLIVQEAYVANMDLLKTHTWRNFVQVYCSTFEGEAHARQALIGEAVERYCGNNTRALPLRKATYAELTAVGEHAVDPDTLILYSQRQYADPTFPFVRFTRDLPVWWVLGRSLTLDRPAWIPASFVYVNWYLDDFAHEPVTNYHHFPGMQAGPSLDFALASAIEEVVERDTMMVWWANRQPLPAVQLSPDLQALWNGQPTALGQRAWAIFLENEFDLPVIAGIVENTEEQFMTFGFAVRPDPIQAIRKAWAEALGAQQGLRDMNLPEDECIVRTLLASRGDTLYPWRADRKYLDDCDPTFRDMITLARQPQIFLDPRARNIVRPWVDVSADRPLETLPSLPERSVGAYRRQIERCGYEIFYADVTTPDIALCGLYTVHVIIPGLVPNFPAAFPTLGGGRLQHQAVRLGWRETPHAEDALNRFPLPFVY